MKAPIKPSESTWALLAVMRWVLAGIVLMVHLRATFVPTNAVIDFIVSLGGKAAVMGFFLISGYSIAHSYGERPEGYFRRRFLRIYPIYLVAVLFTQLVVYLAPSPAVCLDGYAYVSAGFRTSVANALLLQDFAAIALTYNIPLWTLSLEVFYYVLAPFLYRRSQAVLVAVIIVSMVVFHLSPAPDLLYGYKAIVFFWPWLIGFLLGRDAGRLSWPIGLGLIGALLVFLNKKETVEPLSIVPYLATFILILLAPYLDIPRLLRVVANFLGELSYPLYLFHLPLAIFFFKCLGLRGLPGFLVAIIGSTVILWYIFDEKLKRWLWVPAVDSVIRFARSNCLAWYSPAPEGKDVS
ncbi:MAG TPA: acyltransferase [Candidatus Methylacidiphilales bacterium]|nr:acyltransferase [Candidatus Methylacidiphilales bacterium]